jgi:hypothetical protein
MTVKIDGQEWSMDGYLVQNLDLAKELIRKDWDMVIVVDGAEGSGKSVLAMQCAKYCDPTFNIERVCFNSKQFIDCVNNSEKYQAIVFDEAMQGLLSREAMGEINKTLVKMVAEIRQRNLFIFIVLPSFFDLDKYMALWRSRVLIHVYTDENMGRGQFCFFNYNKKLSLYVQGKKYYSYFRPTANFIGSFTNHYVITEADYRKRKLTASEMATKDRKEDRWIKQRDACIRILARIGWTEQKITDEIIINSGENISQQSVHVIISKIPKENEVY